MFDWLSIRTPLKLMIKTSEQRHSRHSCAFVVDLEHILHIGFHAYFTYILQIHISIILN